ncbi:MAG: CDP-diacylglycerol--glycerol-3-phosphate 3-phosphatidyltransferase [Verrucomicrobiae bacterium]|nr:CDP-diacylglycerol--glycerol-3-phosphate 3-phosphatidyltransferase [Verrucomicrobiae bacterium]MCP5539930.1 CDP-diacylglycerol--glycerol-3-phosphate 3-phosphatidyltransferase [Akkermansiaceae bacterium]MCP5551374.1 CDP-diacylglycerol--glycerol-3-phosphate 3-phosphatidyltransferase [Akkermansiaceae bacterium]
MNLPNKLTVLRLILTFVFLAVIPQAFAHAKSIALVVFSIAAFTDFLDGHLARKHNLVTSFGKLMDPLADKVLMCAGFVMLSELRLVPGWVVVLILAREFLVTGLRLVASAEGVVLAAEGLGKQKTIWQIVTAIYFLTYLASSEPAFGWIRFLFDWKPTGPAIAGEILVWLSLALTLLSGLRYAWRNRELLRDC